MFWFEGFDENFCFYYDNETSFSYYEDNKARALSENSITLNKSPGEAVFNIVRNDIWIDGYLFGVA